MSPTKRSMILGLMILLALATVAPARAAPALNQPAAPLNVSISYSPSTVAVNTPTTLSYSITGGTGPYTIWQNNTPSGCNPPSIPLTTPDASGSNSCTPTVTGNFNVHVDVQDSLGDRGSASTYLSVTSSGGSGGSGSGTGGNGTTGLDLSFLQNLLPVIMITGILFLGSVVAIAVSAVALAILVPRRLKQIRKALEGEPMKTPKASKSETPAVPPPPPKEQPPSEEL